MFAAQNSAPVSYTHLDVYKRQEMVRVLRRIREDAYTPQEADTVRELAAQDAHRPAASVLDLVQMCIRDRPRASS